MGYASAHSLFIVASILKRELMKGNRQFLRIASNRFIYSTVDDCFAF